MIQSLAQRVSNLAKTIIRDACIDPVVQVGCIECQHLRSEIRRRSDATREHFGQKFRRIIVLILHIDGDPHQSTIILHQFVRINFRYVINIQHVFRQCFWVYFNPATVLRCLQYQCVLRNGFTIQYSIGLKIVEREKESWSMRGKYDY